MGVRTNHNQESATDPVYVCRGCGEAFGLEHYICPECGGYSVERPYAGRVADVDNHAGTWVGRLVGELKRRFSMNRSFTESNTARVRR